MARGIAARCKGDKFYKDDIEYIVENTFVSTIQEFHDTKEIYKDFQIVEFHPKRGTSTHCIGISLRSEDKLFLYVKYLTKIGDGSGFGRWMNKEFCEQTGFKFKSTSSNKESLPYKPSVLIGDRTISLFDIKDVVCQRLDDLSSSKSIDPNFKNKMFDAFKDIEKGKLPIFKDSIHEHSAIRDYIGEIFAPIAFANNVGIEGVSINNIPRFSGVDVIETPLIRYETTSNANLIDSTLIWPNELEIGLSSKGGSGASASVFSLFMTFQKLEKENKKVYNQIANEYKKEIKFLRFIFHCGIKAGPIVAGYLLSLISYKDMVFLLELLGQEDMLPKLSFVKEVRSIDFYDSAFVDFTHFGNTTLAQDCYKYKSNLSERFYSLISKRKVKDPERAKFEYFALSAIAKAVADVLNQNILLRMSDFLSEALKSIHFIQIHAKTKAIGNDIHFMAFETIYPPVFSGSVLIEADKSFYSTKQPQGGFGFKLSA